MPIDVIGEFLGHIVTLLLVMDLGSVDETLETTASARWKGLCAFR
jgi:hypothetical protein